ncbi:MAG: class I SAM-dependent methyltransferase [Aggregatilineales bacterium]
MRRWRGLSHDKPKRWTAKQWQYWTAEALHQPRIDLFIRVFEQSESQIRVHLNTINQNPSVRAYDAPEWAQRRSNVTGLEDLKTLVLLLILQRPAIAVETGVSAGATAAVILDAVAKSPDGRLYSVDVDRPYAHEYGELIPPDCRKHWTLRLQGENPVLPDLLEEIGEIDFFFHDSIHSFRQMTWEYELAWQYLRSGGVLASHDVHASTAFMDFKASHDAEILDGGHIGATGFWIKK